MSTKTLSVLQMLGIVKRYAYFQIRDKQVITFVEVLGGGTWTRNV